jgi:hypothetical protein
MHAHQHHLTPRARFVLRRGVLPWGLPAGVGAAVLVAVGTRGGVDAPSELGTIVIAVVCFGLWMGLVGWMVGDILWDIRRAESDAEGAGRLHRRPPRR